MALNYDYLTATTREIFIPKLIDNIYDKSALLKILQMDHSVKTRGGRKVVEPLKYAKSTARGRYSNYDTFDMTPPDNISAAEYNWGNYYATVSISGDDEDKNMGEAEVLNLLGERVNEAEMTLRDLVTDDIYSGTNTKGIIGLASAVGTGTYAGIAGGTYTWWQSGVDSTGHTESNMKDSTNSSYVITLLQNAFRNAAHLGEQPNLIVTTWKVYDIIENVMEQNARYNKPNNRTEKIGDAGFNVLSFRGVPIVPDEKCPDGYMYVLNTNFLSLHIHPNKSFKFTGFKEPINQDARAGQVLLKAQLSVNNRRMHYAFTNLPS